MAKSVYKNYHVYIGYIGKQLVAVSENKKVVKYYMTNHRGLNKSQYTIEEAYVSDTDMIIKYEDYIIEEFYGYYIPRIDAMIIEMELSSLNDELVSMISQLKRFTLLISHLKNSGNDLDILLSAIKILSKYTVKKKYKKIYKECIKSHNILYCDLDTYKRYINGYIEMKSLNDAYNNAWMSLN